MSEMLPKIRFSSFTDDWEQRKLGDEFVKVNERNDGTFNQNHWISVAKMYFQVPEKVQSNNIDTRTYVMREGDIAFEGHPNSEFKFGRFVANDIGPGVVSELFPIYRHKQPYNNNYWKNAIQLESVMAPIFAKSITSSGNSSNKLDPHHFLRQPILIPSIQEQNKIGSFFKQLDNLITLHQRKLDLLKEQKKGFLQKMFPKDGQLVPEVRFAGFADYWEQRKLEDIFTILDGDRGKNYPGEKDFFNQGETLFLDTGNVKKNGFDFTKKKYITKEKDKALRSGKLELFDFVLTSRGTLGNVAYYSEEIAKSHPSVRINSAMLILRPNMQNTVSDSYIVSVLRGNIIDTFMIKNHVGSAQPHITKKDFSKVEVRIPSLLGEQEKIGVFFQQLDNLITLHQRKLDSLKEQKKGFLQKMFVS